MGLSHISAIIFVERDSQKGIIIGKKGDLLKEIGKRARHDIESLLRIQNILRSSGLRFKRTGATMNVCCVN